MRDTNNTGLKSDSRRGAWSTAIAFALVAVAIVVVVRYLETDQKSAAFTSQAAAPREGSAAESESREAVLRMIGGDGRDSISPAGPNGVIENAEPSEIRAFLELRAIPNVDLVREDLAEFDSEGRDPNWSAQMEVQLQSEVSQASLTLTGSYVECKTSTCIAMLVRPSGAYNQTEQVGLPNGVFSRAMVDIAQRQGLLGRPPHQVLAQNGALVHWQRFFRRCAPDWRCPE